MTKESLENILVAGQPFLLGGKKKCLKTAIRCDLAVSLATATPFLDHFDVPKIRPEVRPRLPKRFR